MKNPLGLEASHYEYVASVHLFWSELDNSLAQVLSERYGLSNPRHLEDLIYPLDVRKKISLIQSLNRRGELTESAAELVPELVWVGENYKIDRNILAHGVVLYEIESGEPSSLWSNTKAKEITLEDLEAIFHEARYARNIAQHFSFRASGRTHPLALPTRPPKRQRAN